MNERDEIGPNLVPDYLTSVREGGFYGWPYSYWGQNVDTRVRPQDPQKVASAIRPDYGLGSHVAALGLAFSDAGDGRAVRGRRVRRRARQLEPQPAGRLQGHLRAVPRRPPGRRPVDFVTGFFGDDGKTRGRPVGVTVDPRGALIVADDLSNTLWRVTPANRPAAESRGPAAPVAPGAGGASGATSGASGDGGEAGAQRERRARCRRRARHRRRDGHAGHPRRTTTSGAPATTGAASAAPAR